MLAPVRRPAVFLGSAEADSPIMVPMARAVRDVAWKVQLLVFEIVNLPSLTMSRLGKERRFVGSEIPITLSVSGPLEARENALFHGVSHGFRDSQPGKANLIVLRTSWADAPSAWSMACLKMVASASNP